MADEIQNADALAEACPKPDDAPPILTPVAARFDRADWWSFVATAMAALFGYWLTLAPNVTLEFSGILSTGAMYAGVPHPPGYPVWTLYSWLFTKLLPFSNIAWRVAIGSAVASALACGLVAMMVSRGGMLLLVATPTFAHLNPTEQKWLRGVCGCVAGLILAFSGIVWDKAVIVDIWPLSLLLFVSVLCLLLRWMIEPDRRRFLFAGFFLFSLLLTSSQEMIVAVPGLVVAIMFVSPKLGRDVAFVVLPLVAIVTSRNQYHAYPRFDFFEEDWPLILTFLAVLIAAASVAVSTRSIGSQWKPACLCGLCMLAGLSLYFFVPIASMTNPPLNWGYPRTVEGFFHVLGRQQYERVHPTYSPWTFLQQLWMLLHLTGKGFGWLFLLFALLSAGLMIAMKRTGRRWMLGLVVVLVCVGPLQLAMLNPPPDRGARELVEQYFAAFHAVLAVWLGLGLIIVGAAVTRRGATCTE